MQATHTDRDQQLRLVRRGKWGLVLIAVAIVTLPSIATIVLNLAYLRNNAALRAGVEFVVMWLAGVAAWMPWVMAFPHLWLRSQAIAAKLPREGDKACGLPRWLWWAMASTLPSMALHIVVCTAGTCDSFSMTQPEVAAASLWWHVSAVAYWETFCLIGLLLPALVTWRRHTKRRPVAITTEHGGNSSNNSSSTTTCCPLLQPRAWLGVAVTSVVYTVSFALPSLYLPEDGGRLSGVGTTALAPVWLLVAWLDRRVWSSLRSSIPHVLAMILFWLGVYSVRHVWAVMMDSAAASGSAVGAAIWFYAFILFCIVGAFFNEYIALAAAANREGATALGVTVHLMLQAFQALVIIQVDTLSPTFFGYLALEALLAIAASTRIHQDVLHSCRTHRCSWRMPTASRSQELQVTRWRLHAASVRGLIVVAVEVAVLACIAAEWLASGWLATWAGFPAVAAELLAANATSAAVAQLEPGCLASLPANSTGAFFGGAPPCTWQRGLLLAGVAPAVRWRLVGGFALSVLSASASSAASLWILARRIRWLRSQGVMGRNLRSDGNSSSGDSGLQLTSIGEAEELDGNAAAACTSQTNPMHATATSTAVVRVQPPKAQGRVSVLASTWRPQESLFKFWGRHLALVLLATVYALATVMEQVFVTRLQQLQATAEAATPGGYYRISDM